MKEKFKRSDIQYYQKLHESYEIECPKMISKACDRHIDVGYKDFDVCKIKLPLKLFMLFLHTRRHDIMDGKWLALCFPLNIKVFPLPPRGKSYWLKDTHYLGFQQDATNNHEMWLYLDDKHKHSTVSLLWLMFHEFRHKMQYLDPNLMSCLENSNREKWLSTYKVRDTALHVFHEIDPLEVDANVFACEILRIPYPESKFSITDETLKLL